MTQRLITLEAWDKKTFPDNPHCANTLRAWARLGIIYPKPMKVGRTWMCQEDARYCESLKAAITHNDTVIMEIINNGKAA